MRSPVGLQRQICRTCQRPKTTCICQWITPIAHEVEVLILQHPLEVGNAKGSAPLLHWSLPHSRMVVGEVFNPQDLQNLLVTPKHTLLLYPDTPQSKALGLPVPPCLEPDWLQNPAKLRLIVLDGTWRKSRKMLYLNPLLQQLPRMSLRDMPASHYLIRKAHRPDQLSTLEATCAALAQLDGGDHRVGPLLAAFEGFVAQQMRYRSSHQALR